MDNVPHLALPLRIVGGAYATVQQDTDDELAATVAAIVSFPLGSRPERPDFGIADPAMHSRPLNLLDIEQAVQTFEPRAQIAVTELPYNAADPLAAPVRIQVAMVHGEEAEA